MGTDALLIVDPDSLLARAWRGPQIPLVCPHLETIRRHRMAILAPSNGKDSGADIVIDWARRGLIPDTKLIFGTYHGRNYAAASDVVARYVVHCSSDIWSPKCVFVPLALDGKPGEMGDYVFVGGRKQRDWIMAAHALRGRKAIFLSDLLPHMEPGPGHTWRAEMVDLVEYKRLIAGARYCVVPVLPGGHPHGHSDVVRSLVAGVPVVVTRGGSCDEYVEHAADGWLADYSTEGFREGIQWVEHNLDWARRYALEFSRHRYTYEAYALALKDVAAELSASG